MRLSGKMTVRFVLYFLLFYVLLFVGTATLFFIIVYQLMSGFYFHDIRALEQLEMEMAFQDAKPPYKISKSLKGIAERSGGIIQLLDEEGRELIASKEHVFPTTYSIKDLATLSSKKGVHSWQLPDGKLVLFREFTQADELLSALIKDEQFPQLSSKQIHLLKKAKATYHLYDAEHKLIYSVGNASATIDLADFLSTYMSVNERPKLLSYKTLPTGEVAVVRMDNPQYLALDPLNDRIFKTVIQWFIIFHVLLLLLMLALSLWIGQRFGKPIFYFLTWIEKLAKNDYQKPPSQKVRQKKDGRLKRRYRIYEDVDHSLTTLTTNLYNNEQTIQRTEQLREDWITGLSHDLKTPLSSLYGYAAFLASKEHEWTKDEVRTFAETMIEKAAYMDALIDDLTYTYQLKNDGIILEKKTTFLYEYIAQYVHRSEWTDVINLTGDDQSIVYIDRNRFERVLDNIVGNAIKHNPPGTNVHIQVTTNQSTVSIAVQDEGTGLPEEALNHLFNRYYRGTNTTTNVKGTGLGLTIAKQLVEAHGGTIQAASSEKGTTITIQLPKIK